MYQNMAYNLFTFMNIEFFSHIIMKSKFASEYL